MKAAMRSALRETLGSMKRGMRNKRACEYGSEGEESPEHEMTETAEQEEQEHESNEDSGTDSRSGNPAAGSRKGTDNKGLGKKVAEAEGAAQDEMNEAGNWREESVRDFFKKKTAPKVRKAGTFASLTSTVKSAKRSKGERG